MDHDRPPRARTTSGGTALPISATRPSEAPVHPRSEAEGSGYPVHPIHPRSEVEGSGHPVHPRSEAEGSGYPVHRRSEIEGSGHPVHPRSELEDPGYPVRLPSRSEHTIGLPSASHGGLDVADTSHGLPPGQSRAATRSSGPGPTAAAEGVYPPPRRDTATPFDFRVADESREQLEELNNAANRLHHTAAAAEDAEEQREREFRTHEDQREDIFLQNEARRNHEAQERSNGIWYDLESRLAALPPPAHPGAATHEDVGAPPADRASIADITSVAQQAASQHAIDVLETVRLEREDNARDREQAAEERERLLDELRVEKERVVQEKDARIRALEDELAQLRDEFEGEKQQRMAEETEARERDRQELAERDDYVRAQLGDITNLVQDQRDMLETKKAAADARWDEKQARRQDKEAQMIELRDMISKIHEDMESDRARSEDDRRQSRDGTCSYCQSALNPLTLIFSP